MLKFIGKALSGLVLTKQAQQVVGLREPDKSDVRVEPRIVPLDEQAITETIAHAVAFARAQIQAADPSAGERAREAAPPVALPRPPVARPGMQAPPRPPAPAAPPAAEPARAFPAALSGDRKALIRHALLVRNKAQQTVLAELTDEQRAKLAQLAAKALLNEDPT